MDDRVQSLDFALGGGEQFADVAPELGRSLAQFPFDELKVDVQGIERVADFVRHAGGQ